MKKLFNIIFFIAFGFMLVSCEKDTGVIIPESKLKVIESSVLFEQPGGTGFIKVEAEGAITAIPGQDWITVTTSGTTVNVTVGANEGMGGRNGHVTIKSGNEQVNVTVMQSPSLFYLVDYNGSLEFPLLGGTLSVNYENRNVPISLTTSQSWVTAVKGADGTINITVDPSAAKRTATVTITALFADGQKSIFTVPISQEMVYEDIIGDYKVTYSTSTSNTNPTRTLNVSLIKGTLANTYLLKGFLADESAGEIVMSYNSATKTVSLLGQIIGQTSLGYDFWLLPYAVSGSSAYTSRTTTYGLVSVFDTTGTNITFKMVSNNVWTTYTYIGFILRNYNSSGSNMGNVTNKDGQSNFYINITFTKQ
ncbi:MAG: hypothetical protein LBN74_04950 [Prevotella sp.]|jgi:hypothetical protein|nr:hypothetical protein [Prevotella sp.]